MNTSWRHTERHFISQHAFFLPGCVAILSRFTHSFARWTIWLMHHRRAEIVTIFAKSWQTGGSGLLKTMFFPRRGNRLACTWLLYWMNTAFPLLFFSTFSTGCPQIWIFKRYKIFKGCIVTAIVSREQWDWQ